MRPPRFLLFVAVVFFMDTLPAARAAEPFFKKGDVIAIVGGEDMVALSEYGYLELLLTRALPDYHLRFRNLAWEGDTVFEQRRDLGFPTWEEQLEKIGATVVLCQFGQMESLAGKEKLPEFIAAYEKLLARFSGGGKRRVVLVELNYGKLIDTGKQEAWFNDLDAYCKALKAMGSRGPGVRTINFHPIDLERWTKHRDGIHLNERGHESAAYFMAVQLGIPKDASPLDAVSLRQLIAAKNRLWFDYWRVQNWAFLAGDRTNQPSSRDHLDRTKRWFPEERERFLPLIEAKEKEIDALAAQLARP